MAMALHLLAPALSAILLLPSASATTQITRTSAFDYDPASGLLVKEMVEPGSADLCVVTTYGIDDYGRRYSSTTRNCNGSAAGYPGAPVEAGTPSAAASFASRQSTNTYTSDQRFVRTTTVAVGQPETQLETRTYDGRFGLVKSLQGPNLLTTNWTYDDFGRKIRERRADDTGTQWDYEYCSGVNGGTLSCPTVGTSLGAYATKSTPIKFAADGTWAVSGPYGRVYYDAVGRKLRSETQGSDVSGASTLVFQDTVYDSVGQVAQQSLPYYSGQTVYWTYFYYDTLGRTIEVRAPNDAGTGQVSTSTNYSGLVTTVTDPLGHTTTEERDVQGNVVMITDAKGGVLRKSYDAFGSLVRSEDDLHNVISTVYDVRGRKTATYDPDMGVWGYCYDALGQLKAQQSPSMRGSSTPGACPSNTGTGKTAVAVIAWTTLAYDNLGRTTQRIEPDATSTWTYDKYADGSTCTKGIGKLCEVSGANAYGRRHVYDALGRPISTTSTVGASYTASVSYDSLGRVDVRTYPTGLTVKNVYTATLGYLKQVLDNRSGGGALWTANTADALGHLTQYTYGSGSGSVVTTNQFFAGTGRLNITRAGSGNSVQNLTHSYDDAGRLSARIDLPANVTATYAYDEVNRVTSETRSGGSLTAAEVISWSYDSIGNMLSRTESGATNTYNYNPSGVGSNLPHAVANVSGFVNGYGVPKYSYDAHGNLTAGAGRTVAWTSFDKAASITKAAVLIDYLYDAEHERTKESYYFNGALQRTTVYLNPAGGGGQFYEEETGVAGIKKKHYISAGGASIGMIVCTADPCTSMANTSTQYWHFDHLGSISVVTNASGAVIERLAYEPFGKRRTSNNVTDANGTLTPASTDRGYTGHEHLDEVSLINMNGRVYDPGLGRFMSADPFVQSSGNLQSFNRYAYAWNSPVNGADPSGYCFMDCFWQPHGRANQNVASAVFRLIRAQPGQAAIDRYVMTHQWAYVAGNIVVSYFSGAAGSALYSSYYTYQGTHDAKAAMKAGEISFGTAMAFYAVGSALPGAGTAGADATSIAMNTAGHVVVGCLSSEAGGGSCRSGALAAGVGAAWTNYGANTSSWGVGGNLAVQVVLGGTASVVGGGSFANGAQTAAFGYLFNELMHSGYGGTDRGRRQQAGYEEFTYSDGTVCNDPASPACQVPLQNRSSDLAYDRRQCVTAECVAGVLPAPSENRTQGQIDISLCETTCSLVGPGGPLPSGLGRKLLEWAGKAAGTKLACDWICEAKQKKDGP